MSKNLNSLSDGLEIDENLLERVNPVFNTAKQTLLQLVDSGDADAKRIVESLSVIQENRVVSDPQIERMTLISMETRYRSMMEIFYASGIKNFVDMPCGYTPRALTFSKQKIPFWGCDLPIVIDEIAPIIEGIATEEEKDYIHYRATDVTNWNSLETALCDAEGPICISTEGLFMYFTDNEMEKLCQNIARLLQQHGGCWVTMDPDTSFLFFLCAKIIFGENKDALLKLANAYSTMAEVGRIENYFISSEPEKRKHAPDVLDKYGLSLERLPLSDWLPELLVYEQLTKEQIAIFKEGAKNVSIWRITLKEGTVLETVSEEQFGFRAELLSSTLKLELSGRMDTITAPQLLAFFEKVQKDYVFSEILIDCSKLIYTSSAGLRVLLIMAKKFPDHVRLTHINDEVLEILQQTGFDSIFQIL